MLKQTLAFWKPKTLQQMFRKLKVAGAHPDVLWGIDAAKAQHNSEEMIRLETVMHERETQALRASSGRGAAAEHFCFWLLNGPTGGHLAGRTPPGPSTALRAVQCTLTPFAQPRVVKEQLRAFFEEAGIAEDFTIANDGVDMSLESVLRYADARQTDHIQQSGTLYIRGDRAAESLRRFGVLLAIEEDGYSYLVTLPEAQPIQPSNDSYITPAGGAASGSSYQPGQGIIGPNGEIHPDAQAFMTERGLRPFDLRMAGSHASVERFVNAFERLERVYTVHRGRALRPAVCIVLSLKSVDNFISSDGCIILAVQRMPAWEEFLLSIPQEVWQDCVRQHRDWRVGHAPLLRARQRQLARVADMFNFFRVTMEAPLGGWLHWPEDLIRRFMKEEVTVRRTLDKYKLKSDLLKRRGTLCIVDGLYSAIPDRTGTRAEIGYRIGGDGKITLNQRRMNTGQMLRVLRDNLRRAEDFQLRHDRAITALEKLSRDVPVDFSVDTVWKQRAEGNLVNCLDVFVRTIHRNQRELGAFLHHLLHQPAGAGGMIKKRMVWVISDRFDTMPSGVLFIPYDVDFESIKKVLLPH